MHILCNLLESKYFWKYCNYYSENLLCMYVRLNYLNINKASETLFIIELSILQNIATFIHYMLILPSNLKG
jgi:hypothetical protein